MRRAEPRCLGDQFRDGQSLEATMQLNRSGDHQVAHLHEGLDPSLAG
jgi:hypothetical protein